MRGTCDLIVQWSKARKLSLSGMLLLAGVLLSLAVPSLAQRDQFGYGPETFDFDESQVKEWKESLVPVPPYPTEHDLIGVPLASRDALKLYIDVKSISRAPDRVTRFTLVVEASSGARNVFYDGLRCETRQYKTYAIGTADRGFAPIKDAKWREIPRPEINAFRAYLYKHYVCDERHTARAPEELLRLIKYSP